LNLILLTILTAESRLFFEMIDLHAHILCNIDDGMETIEETLEAIKHLSSFGYREILPTPHKFHMFYDSEAERVQESMKMIKSTIIKRFSFEYMYSKESISNESDLYEISMTKAGFKVILVEFLPLMARQTDVEKAVFLLNTIKIAPLLAHIERYMLPDEFWVSLKEKYSVFYQGGIKKLAGRFFDPRKKQILRLLDSDLLDNMGTDIHKIDDIPIIEKGLNYLFKKYPNSIEKLFSINFE